MRIAKPVNVSTVELEILKRYSAGHTFEKRLSFRAEIILHLHSGLSPKETADKLNTSEKTVHKWKKRWKLDRMEGLADLPRPGNVSCKLDDVKKAEIISIACSKPGDGRKRRTQRETARISGVSLKSVWKTLNENVLKPHKTEYWCGKSPDPEFVEKAVNIIGLYMNPPRNALVLCVDEKTQIQALDATQKVLSAKPGRPEKRTVTYKRNGTANLIAALSTADGEITPQFIERNTAENFLKFLKRLYRKYTKKTIYVIADNLVVHKQKDVKAWIASKRRLHMYHTPTYASWLNQVELFFSIMARQVLRNAVWKSKEELVATLMKYIHNYNRLYKKPFSWTYGIGNLIKETKH